jgi:hypothetical protein
MMLRVAFQSALADTTIKSTLERRCVMSTNIRALTITGAVIAAFTYIICASFVALAPEMATTLGAYIVHMDLSKLGRSVTIGGGLTGGAFFTMFVAFVCASSGWL